MNLDDKICKNCGKVFWNPKKTIAFCSPACRYEVFKLFDGKNRFRETIRKRDLYVCQCGLGRVSCRNHQSPCGKYWKEGERRFDVHHLNISQEGRSREKGICKIDKANKDSLVTLCHRCHINLPHLALTFRPK